MNSELVERLKRIPLRKDIGFLNGRPRNPASTRSDLVFEHPDLPDVEFKSRSALKKAVRLQRYGKNSLRKKNDHRLESAIRSIFYCNRVDMHAIAKGMIADRVARLTMPDTTDLSALLERIVREEVSKALSKAARTGTSTNKLADFIKDIALVEVRRLVVENLEIDVNVTGHAWATTGTRRAMRLQPGAEDVA